VSEEPSALEARGLTKRYRDVVALSECSFQLPAHRIIALVGANGAGKSTLMSIAAGLLPAHRRQLTHALLDEQPQTAALHRVRDMLVEVGVLPARDEYLERIEPWLGGVLAGRPAQHAAVVFPRRPARASRLRRSDRP
jgi:ABC-type multidrug transport system ATPase subunit